jgi:O-methyltransferase
MSLTLLIKKIAGKLGFNTIPYCAEQFYSADVPASLIEIYKKVKPYTMTSPERVFALCEAVKYIHEKNIEGIL